MSKAEATIQAEVMLAIGAQPGVRIFRNSVGQGWTGELERQVPGGFTVLRNARRVTFGLCPGSSDLIGWRSVTVTPDMVGQKVAVFTAPEVKTATGGARPDQVRFMEAVRKAGGIAGIVRSDTDAKNLLGIT